MRYPLLAFAVLSLGLVLASPAVAARRPILSITTERSPSVATVTENRNNIPVATFTVHAWRDSVTIDSFTLHNCIAERDIDGDCADADESLGNDAAVRAVRITYVDAQGNTRRKSTTFVNGMATFSNLKLFIAKGKSADVNVLVSTADFGEDVASGAQFQLNFNAREGTLHGTSATTKRAFTQEDVGKNWAAPTMTLRNTAITFALAADSPSGKRELGMQEALRFTASPTDNAATLTSISLALDASDKGDVNWDACRKLGTDANNFALADANGNLLDVTWSAYDELDRPCSTSRRGHVAYLLATFAEAQTLATDTATAYTFSVNTSLASASRHDTLSISLTGATWSDGTVEGAAITDGFAELPLEGNTLIF